ncbi:MAG: flagellar biosynthesis protein FlhF [Acetatifactor sp.]|nr:flagellar biosynthesis protein FlhF [Acetatifactor sp.]
MIIKKFVGKTEEEATETARKELGNGLVVMNVKTTKKKGFSGVFGGKQVEVTVALEEDSDSLQAVRREAARIDPDAAKLEEGVRVAQNAVNVMSESSQNIEKKLDSLQTMLVTRFQQEEAKGEHADDEAAVQEGEAKEGETAPDDGSREQEKFIRLLYNTMMENEVDEKYANQIVDDVEKNRKPNLPFDYILANVYQKMILKFGKAEGITPAAKGPKTLLFMGPTGIGKTTTIAKIASHFSVEQKKKVALLTADTYRIAAAEQLRTYANILEAPFRVIYSEEEAKAAVSDFRDFDYIFVDTAGHSHQNEELLEKMKLLLEAVQEAGECQTFLVLSATTKYRDLQRIAASYKEITDYQMIFTKLDETSSLGNLMNLRLCVEAPIAYVTFGQNVPDDIELFNPQKTVKSLLSTGRRESL